MKLESVKYSQFKNKPNEWDLDPLILGHINLIVGKNATGKTKALNMINNLAGLLRGEIKPAFTSAHFDAHFENKLKKSRYIVSIEEGKVIEEKFFNEEGTELLTRGSDGVGQIFAQKLDKFMEFQTPPSELALNARRDNIQHPYFEPLYQWASSVYHYAFGSQHIQLNFPILELKPSCILIDDIGVGLDYERSSALVELLMSKIEASQIQLIMTTNDYFVMNKVPLEKWSILHKEGSRCKVFNKKNAQEQFEEFKFTGLNNFNFFSTDYLGIEGKDHHPSLLN